MKFAVVGRANKGKSSIVATLVENDEILISPLPGTTRRTQEFHLTLGERTLFSLVDTPGFEEAPAVLEWLQQETVAAHQRPQRIREFYETFKDSGRYQFECELLKPILAGAAILYVVDASHPYRANFEAEFEILRWTGRPSIALLNQTGDGRWLKEWQHALDQYFKKTLLFNSHTAVFAERIRIMEELRFLSDETRPAIDEAIALLRSQHASRLQATALVLAEFINQAVAHKKKFAIRDGRAVDAQKSAWIEEFYDELRESERKTRDRIAAIFNYRNLETEESDLQRTADLFDKETWEILGLSRGELIATGTVAGAFTGGTIDASVGAASFGLGAGIGAVLGGIGSTYLAFSKPQLAGMQLSQQFLTVGPITNPNFPWILLDRGLLFVTSILRRTHAQRGQLKIEERHKGPSSALAKKAKGTIALLLQKTRFLGVSEKANQQLARPIRAALESV